jgi:hypothetical protein
MATILHLNISITQLPLDELYDKLRGIRAQRRVRPTKKIRAKTAPKHTKIPKDPFALIATMTPEQKVALAAKLLNN